MENFEQSPVENITENEYKQIVMLLASFYCIAKKMLLNHVQFISLVYKDLDLKDLLKDTMLLNSDYELFRTLLYMNFKGEVLKPKSLYRVFKNDKRNT